MRIARCSARVAWYEAYAGSLEGKGCLEPKSSSAGTKDRGDWRIVDQAQAGKVLAAIYSLPPILRSWGDYLFQPDLDVYPKTKTKLALEQALFVVAKSEFQPTKTVDGVYFDRLERLAVFAVREAKSIENSGKSHFKASELYGAIGINKSHWVDSGWSRRWQQLLKITNSWTELALKPVNNVISEEIERERIEMAVRHGDITTDSTDWRRCQEKAICARLRNRVPEGYYVKVSVLGGDSRYVSYAVIKKPSGDELLSGLVHVGDIMNSPSPIAAANAAAQAVGKELTLWVAKKAMK